MDLDIIGARHDVVAFFCAVDEAAGALNEALRRLRDVPALVERLRAVGAVTPKQTWRALLDSIVALLQLAEARRGLCHIATRAARILTRVHTRLRACAAGVRGARVRRARRAGAVRACRRRRQRDGAQVCALLCARWRALLLISPAPLCARSVYELIAGVIDFEDNADDGGDPDQAGVMVQHGVSDELDQMKHLYDGAHTMWLQ